jgi:hypothetical protein
LTSEEEEIRQLIFPDLPSRKVLQILSIEAWTTLEIGERMLERGKSKNLGLPDAAQLPNETLAEEKAVDAKLSEIGATLLVGKRQALGKVVNQLADLSRAMGRKRARPKGQQKAQRSDRRGAAIPQLTSFTARNSNGSRL